MSGGRAGSQAGWDIPVTSPEGVVRLSAVPAETHVNNDPIGRDEILEIVRDRLADIL